VGRLQKAVRDFTRDLSLTQSQLETTQREKTMLLSKSLDLEKLHVQIKEQMGAEINYLRQLNLQMLERQFKGQTGKGLVRVCIWLNCLFFVFFFCFSFCYCVCVCCDVR